MRCFKLWTWFEIDFECPYEDYIPKCNVIWVVFSTGVSTKVCVDCAILLACRNLTERSG